MQTYRWHAVHQNDIIWITRVIYSKTAFRNRMYSDNMEYLIKCIQTKWADNVANIYCL